MLRLRHTMCPRSSYPILYSNLLYKMGNYFLDRRYVQINTLFFTKVPCGQEVLSIYNHGEYIMTSWTSVWVNQIGFNVLF